MKRPYWIDKQSDGTLKVYTDNYVNTKLPRIRNTARRVWATSKQNALDQYKTDTR